ncbi:MAG TPA: COX15/CtaA family protein [Longimicrobium sp.]|jgi:heme A synthase
MSRFRSPAACARYAWGVLAFNVVVVLWGAVVRATGSGAGCGRHWPRCNGEILPELASAKTMVEFTHRVTSGLAFLLMVGLLVWARRAFPVGHAARRGAGLAMIFMVLEALLGAGLVLFELVAENKSAARAFSMAAHLANTFLLLGAITLTAWWASGGERVRVRRQGSIGAVMMIAVAATMIVGVTGSLTALGDTLFPKTDLGISVGPAAHFLERLRIVHPLFAVATAVYVTVAGWMARRNRPGDATLLLSRLLAGLFGVQLFAGVMNIVLRVPLWMQLVHLFLADAVWIVLVLTTAATLADRSEDEPASAATRRARTPATV